MKRVLLTMIVAATLAACGEEPQTQGTSRQDASPYKGTGKAFAEQGWKQGDKTSWESHLKVRAQQGQNDYNRMN